MHQRINLSLIFLIKGYHEHNLYLLIIREVVKKIKYQNTYYIVFHGMIKYITNKTKLYL